MAATEVIELRADHRSYATLRAHPDGRTTLEHRLTKLDVDACGELAAYDRTGGLLMIAQGGEEVTLTTPDGITRLTIQQRKDGELDVTDPAKKIQLVVKLSGLGSKGSARLGQTGFVFGLRWIVHR